MCEKLCFMKIDSLAPDAKRRRAHHRDRLAKEKPLAMASRPGGYNKLIFKVICVGEGYNGEKMTMTDWPSPSVIHRIVLLTIDILSNRKGRSLSLSFIPSSFSLYSSSFCLCSAL